MRWPVRQLLPLLLLLGPARGQGDNSTGVEGEDEGEEGLLDKSIDKEKFHELEEKIPGLKDGMYKSPKDGKWKKVKSISRVPSTGNEEAEDAPVGEADKPKKKVKSVKKVKKMKKIKQSVDIDEDLALKMKAEAESGKTNEAEAPEEPVEPAEPAESAEPADEPVTADLQAKIDRVLKMFNASDLDDIVKVTPIESLEKLPDTGELPDTEGQTLGLENESDSAFEAEKLLPMMEADDGLTESLAAENSKVRDLEGKLQIEVEELGRDSDTLGREKSMQVVLAKMLAVQEDKVAKIKELMADHRAKELSANEVVSSLQKMVKVGKTEVMEHLDVLKNLADKVRSNEMDRINKYTDTFSNIPESIDPGMFEGELDIRDPARAPREDLEGGRQLSSYKESTRLNLPFDEGALGLKHPINKARKIKKMRKILSITDLTEEQAQRLLKWQKKRSSSRR